MSMDEALRDLILTYTPVASVVERRVDWGVRPQGDHLPAITLWRISSIRQMNLAGASRWTRDRIQIDCWGRTYKAAKDLAMSLAGEDGLLVGYRGEHLETRMRIFAVGMRSDHDEDTVGIIHRTSIDVMVWHTSL